MPQIAPNVKHKRNFFHKSRQPLFMGGHLHRFSLPSGKKSVNNI